MKKYLKEIEVSGMILLIIGIVCSYIWGKHIGVWPCVCGLILWFVSFIYKAFHWTEYARENKNNIIILIIAICLLIFQMIARI